MLTKKHFVFIILLREQSEQRRVVREIKCILRAYEPDADVEGLCWKHRKDLADYRDP